MHLHSVFRLLPVVLCVAGAAIAATPAQRAGSAAQAYPDRPIRFIVPYTAGGNVDFIGRTVAQKLSETFGQSVVVDNRPGGASNIGAEIVARAAPDGYTLLIGGTANTVNMTLYRRLSYDVVKDFAPVSLLTIVTNILVLHPSIPAKSVKELIALAKARPGELTYASAGIASSTHLAAELFKMMAGVDILHVPYKGGGAVVTDLLGGRVSMYFGTMPSSLPHVRTGKLRALAVTSDKRSAGMPELPTIAESGLPGYGQSSWQGLMAPAATPRDIVARLHAETIRVLSLPDVRERLVSQGADVIASSPEELAEFIQTDVAKSAKLVRSLGLKVD
ncbi:MAG: tripartite tricarboxylate transporter substrate binding protein [Betaproteobacteria bacterium]|nr:tripartite tricarboxylate transporter substrate binding protein [Betaproteobacteria bacterium]